MEMVEQARGRLDSGAGEVTLDFSAVERIGARELRALETLAQAAAAKSIPLSLHGVNVGVYKVLKVARASAGVLLH
jgi:hypothetical protein